LGPVNATFSVSPDAGGKVDGSMVSATKAGTWTVTASKDGVNAIASLTVNPGPATKFTVAKNVATKANNGVDTYSVTALDTYGNTVTDYAGQVWLGCNTDVSIPRSVTLVNGVATFNVTQTEDAPMIFASTTELQSPLETPAPTETPATLTASLEPSPTADVASSLSLSSFNLIALIAASVIVIVFVSVAVKRKKVKLPKKLLDIIAHRKGQIS
jgi:hypothetical protein